MIRPATPCSAAIPIASLVVCYWCQHPVASHPFIDATRWSPAGPFLGAGQVERRVPNPRFQKDAS